MTTAKSKKADTPASAGVGADSSKPNTLYLERKDGKSEKRLVAEVAFSPVSLNAMTACLFQKNSLGVTDLTESVKVLREQAGQARDGDLSQAQELLYAQATVLNAIFHEMCRRAAANMGEYLNAAEVYMRLGLKAQAQSRATLETLAEIQNPKAVAFVRQANIANGPQQVNNAPPAAANEPVARAGEPASQPNELLEHHDAQRLDNGATLTATRVNSQMETVGALDRSQDK
jgi:hypothetical protein